MAEQKGAAALGIGQHLAPADGGGIPEAQEGESRLGYHDAGAGQRGAHDKQMGDAGQDVAEHDMAPAGTGQLGRLDVVAVFEHQNLRAHNPGKAGPAEDGEDENDHEIALAKEIGQHNGQRKGGDDEKDIHHPHHHHIHDSAEIAGQNPHQRTEESGSEAGRDPDHQGDPGAVDQHAENILPGGDSGAERMGEGGGEPLLGPLGHVIGIIGRDQGGENRQDDQQPRDE